MDESVGGEPYWVVVAEIDSEDQDYVGATVDAPDQDEAEAEAIRRLVGEEGEAVGDVARVTGAFPQLVRTEERERRPEKCLGCGLNRYCGNHPPIPQQTWFEELEEQSDEDSVAWECIQCGTLTRSRRDGAVPAGGGDRVVE